MMPNVLGKLSPQMFLILTAIVFFPQLSARPCCTAKLKSVFCGSGMSYVPEPPLPGRHREAIGYCAYNISGHCSAWESTTADKILLLDLTGADFTKLPEIVFSYFPKLERINLEGNKLQILKENSFSVKGKANNLRELNLGDNKINSIHPGAFKGLEMLETLNLDGNLLTSSSIPEEVFDPLVNLKELRIERNELEKINIRWFQSLHKLEILFLSSNRMRSLPQLPASLKKLEEIVLNGNEISEVKDRTFAELMNLKKIKLSRNNIRAVGEQAFQDNEEIQYIDIGHNKLSTIPRSTFACLRDLRVLVISGNQLTTAYPEWFASILNNCDKFSPTDRKGDPEPESVVGGNPWRCDEDMDELAILIETCVDFEMEVKRCAKQLKLSCSGQEGKYLREVRNNSTIAREKYKAINISEDSRCDSFLPKSETCVTNAPTRPLVLVIIKVIFSILVGCICFVTLFLSVKYFKEWKQKKSQSMFARSEHCSCRNCFTNFCMRSTARGSSVSLSFLKPTFNPEETIPKIVLQCPPAVNPHTQPNTPDPNNTEPKEVYQASGPVQNRSENHYEKTMAPHNREQRKEYGNEDLGHRNSDQEIQPLAQPESSNGQSTGFSHVNEGSGSSCSVSTDHPYATVADTVEPRSDPNPSANELASLINSENTTSVGINVLIRMNLDEFTQLMHGKC